MLLGLGGSWSPCPASSGVGAYGFFLPYPVCNGHTVKLDNAQALQLKYKISSTIAELPMDKQWLRMDPATGQYDTNGVRADSFWGQPYTEANGVCFQPNSAGLYRAVATPGTEENAKFTAFAEAWKNSCPATDCHFEYGVGTVCQVAQEYGGPPPLTEAQKTWLSMAPAARPGMNNPFTTTPAPSTATTTATPAVTTTATTTPATTTTATVLPKPTVTAIPAPAPVTTSYQRIAQSYQPSSPYSVLTPEKLSFSPSGAITGSQEMRSAASVFDQFSPGYEPMADTSTGAPAPSEPQTGGSSATLLLVAAAVGAYFYFGRKK